MQLHELKNYVMLRILGNGEVGEELEHPRRLRRLPSGLPGVFYKKRVFPIYKSNGYFYIDRTDQTIDPAVSPIDTGLTGEVIPERAVDGIATDQPIVVSEPEATDSVPATPSVSAVSTSLVRPNEVSDLTKFATEVQQDILDESLTGYPEEKYCSTVLLEYLLEAEEIDDFVQLDFSTRGARLDAYSVNVDENRVDLFTTLHLDVPALKTADKSRVEGRIRTALAIAERSVSGIPPFAIEHPELLGFVRQLRDMLRVGQVNVRVFVLTDGVATLDSYASSSNSDYSISVQIWDLRRFFRRRLAAWAPEPIAIDFNKILGHPIPIVGGANSSELQTMLTIIPGKALAELYDEHGQRLLEGNVRSYLQNRGKINRGILNTVGNEPQRFITYNNGISVVANSAELSEDENGAMWLDSCDGFQIVNGAQTTASIHRAFKIEKMDVSTVEVQAKITVVPSDQSGVVTPLISEFSNTQNRIQASDFSANDPFHRKIEVLSRRMWAPPKAEDDAQIGSLWFYERARGQYADALFRARTPADKRRFKNENPSSQKFAKTDLAKYYHSWSGQPDIVSLGAQKNFKNFVSETQAQIELESVDEGFYQRIVGMAILFKGLDSIVRRQQLPGYKANVVTYTIAIFAKRHSNDQYLDSLWREQQISRVDSQVLDQLSRKVRATLISSAGEGNVTEFAKSKDAWFAMRSIT
jgi:hypothetical protein